MSNIGTVLRDWKAMVHPPFYNHRTALADAVFPVLGVHVAIAILSGIVIFCFLTIHFRNKIYICMNMY